MDLNDTLYQVRLECLKLANVKHANTADVIHTAKEYEKFVREDGRKSQENFKNGNKKSIQEQSRELLK